MSLHDVNLEKPERRHQLNVRLPPEALRQIQQIAAYNRRSLSQQMVFMIDAEWSRLNSRLEKKKRG